MLECGHMVTKNQIKAKTGGIFSCPKCETKYPVDDYQVRSVSHEPMLESEEWSDSGMDEYDSSNDESMCESSFGDDFQEESESEEEVEEPCICVCDDDFQSESESKDEEEELCEKISKL